MRSCLTSLCNYALKTDCNVLATSQGDLPRTENVEAASALHCGIGATNLGIILEVVAPLAFTTLELQSHIDRYKAHKASSQVHAKLATLLQGAAQELSQYYANEQRSNTDSYFEMNYELGMLTKANLKFISDDLVALMGDFSGKFNAQALAAHQLHKPTIHQIKAQLK